MKDFRETLDLLHCPAEKQDLNHSAKDYLTYQTWVLGAKSNLDNICWSPNKCIGTLEPFTHDDYDKLIADLENPFYIAQSILVIQHMFYIQEHGTDPNLLKDYKEIWYRQLKNKSWIDTLRTWVWS